MNNKQCRGDLRQALLLIAAVVCLRDPVLAQWNSFARNAQHTAESPTASQVLNRIHWQTPVDLAPQYSGNELLIHYGSPLITAANTVIVPVKTGATGGFRVDAHGGNSGSLLWSFNTNYVLPSHNWTPVFGPVLTSAPRLYIPGGGGTVFYRNSPDAATGAIGLLAFYGLLKYLEAPRAYNASVRINTPLTADSAGNIYFGFVVVPNSILWPLYDSSGRRLTSGIARISASGHGSWTPVTTAAADATVARVVQNCAPAISLDGSTLYIAVTNGSQGGYLVALSSATLAPVGRVRLKGPLSGADASLSDDASASPTVGPDGDVYYGVLENPCCENDDRGWLLHFNGGFVALQNAGRVRLGRHRVCSSRLDGSIV